MSEKWWVRSWWVEAILLAAGIVGTSLTGGIGLLSFAICALIILAICHFCWWMGGKIDDQNGGNGGGPRAL